MASVIKRGDTWFLKYQNADGKRVREASPAKTRTEAMRLATELEQKAWRQRKGLEAREDPFAAHTVTELVDWYRTTYLAGRPSAKVVERATKNHITPAIGSVLVRDLTSGMVETFLQSKVEALGPQSLNHLRGYLLQAFERARKAGQWRGLNPVVDVDARKIPRQVYDHLRVEEVQPLLQVLSTHYRPYFAAALFTAMRKGELAGLRKTDVDLAGRRIYVRRSYDRDTTKGGHADVIPIATELLPFLQAAMEASQSDLVFPAPSGEMLREDFKAARKFRTALRAAGIVTGYTHKCRRKGCGHQEAAKDGDTRRCPKCETKLWATGQVRPLRFHDLRGTCASLLLQAGVSIDIVAAILRHSDPRITRQRYAHLAPEFLQAEINRLPSLAVGVRTGSAPSPENQKAPESRAENPSNPGPYMERAKGFGPSTPSLGSEVGAVGGAPNECDPPESEHLRLVRFPPAPSDPIESLISGSIWGPTFVQRAEWERAVGGASR